MPELDDNELLAEFARNGSETAFATLVARYVNLVYATALRFTGAPHHAEEITQAVFIILARKAGSLRGGTVLSGWLYQTARLTAANVVKSEIRRQRREQEAYMQSTLNAPDPAAWGQIAPLLDDAMGRLGETDRNAVVLRFFENKTAREVAAALQLTEAAAHKRVNRALDKLRQFFAKRGVTLTTAILANVVSVNSVHAAPAGLAASVSTVAVAKGATAGVSTLTLVKGILKLMAWTKAKTAAVAVAAVLVATGTTTLVVKHITPKPAQIPDTAIDDSFFDLDSKKLFSAPPGLVVIRPTHFSGGGPRWACTDGKTTRMSGKKQSLGNVIDMAYGSSPVRRVLTADFPKGDFDFLVTVSEKPQEQLQAEIRRQFGLVGRWDTREMEVFDLRIKTPGAPGLKKAAGKESGESTSDNRIRWRNQSMEYFAHFLECQFDGELKRPVVDRTGLKGGYDFTLEYGVLEWNRSFKQAMLDQCGLELVPDREPVEMLVVERAN